MIFFLCSTGIQRALAHRGVLQIAKTASEHSFVGTSVNAVMIQIWTAMIAYILLKYLQAKATYKWNMSNLSNFLRMASFAKIHLFDWLDHPVEVEKPPPEEQIQLAL